MLLGLLLLAGLSAGAWWFLHGADAVAAPDPRLEQALAALRQSDRNTDQLAAVADYFGSDDFDDAGFDAKANETSLEGLHALTKELGYDFERSQENRLAAWELNVLAARARKRADLEVIALYEIGYLAVELARFDVGTEAIDPHLERLLESDTLRLPALLLQRGVVARYAADYVGAREYLHRALELFETRERDFKDSWLPYAYAEMFTLDLELGQPGKAAAWLEKQFAVTTHNDISSSSVLALNEARLAYFTGRHRRAVKLANRALDKLKSDQQTAGQEPAPWTRPHALKLRLLIENARFQLGENEPGAVEAIVKDVRQLDGAPWAFLSDALFLEALHASALGQSKRAQEIVDELQLTRPDAQDTNVRTPLPGCRIDALALRVAREVGLDTHRQGILLDAWESSFESFLRFWKHAPIDPDGVGFLALERRRFPLVEGIAGTLAVHGESDESAIARAFEYLVRAQAQGTLSRQWGIRPPSLDQIRDLLGPGQGVYALLPGPRVTHLFLLDDTALTHHRLGGEAELERALEALSIGRPMDPDSNDWIEPVGQLSRLLLPDDVQARLARWSSIAVVGTDLLGTLPFAWLTLDGKSIGATYAIAHWPSIPLIVEMQHRTKATTRSRRALVTLTPDLSSDQERRFGPLADIPLDDSFVTKAFATFDGLSVDVLRGHEVQRACLDGTAFDDRELWLYLGHGVELSREVRPSALLWTPTDEHPSGLIRCADLEAAFESRGAPRLVVLAACEASEAKRRAGDEGLGHLGGALISRGSSTVVLSSAKLDRDATIQWVEVFLEHLGLGASPAEAARQARRTVALTDGRHHPYYHSRIRVVGLGL